jgi:hypothetical protein
MKIADLHNEHRLKFFKGAGILFGFIWGILGILLILSNNVIGNIILAMTIAFIFRMRIDYINHAISASLIIIGFLSYGIFQPMIFLSFYLIFLVFGSLKDYIDDVLKRKDFVYKLNEIMLYYPIPALIYSILFNNWIVFFVFLLYTISYDLTKYYGMKLGYR